MYNVEAVVESIMDEVKRLEHRRLLALALKEAEDKGLDVTGQLYEALEEGISLQNPALRS
jgi:hypothetical protein